MEIGSLADYATPEHALTVLLNKHSDLAARIRAGRVGSRWHCDGCSGTIDDYMLTNDLWTKIHPEGQSGYLCLGCATRRLGRPLSLSDFSDAIVNVPILVGVMVGYRLAQGEARCDS